MTYLKVRWLHSDPTYPIWLYSELDQERWEVRKVEVFANGEKGFASDAESFHRTELGSVPTPSPAEISADAEFQLTEISQEEFEVAWAARHTATDDLRLTEPDKER
ncbi:MAG: hypothetical protein U0836_04005 [Pirellulales bacterium]